MRCEHCGCEKEKMEELRKEAREILKEAEKLGVYEKKWKTKNQ